MKNVTKVFPDSLLKQFNHVDLSRGASFEGWYGSVHKIDFVIQHAHKYPSVRDETPYKLN